ncbi:MAG: DUF5060 domain-containing protein [Alphaproteobacteria bacterium]|nr:DUF5060 domain-containing protein [Alphaproteobacteria bacterium]
MTYPVTRRAACGLGLAALATPAGFARGTASPAEQWGMFEVSLKGPASGNPFVDVHLSATFQQGTEGVEADGFYDGDGVYRIRFMPGLRGEWRYRTKSNVAELDGKTGVFVAGAPAAGNHGPVAVANTFHFAYADGTPYKEIGTTCYAWIQQPDARCDLTVKTLAASPFNKIRMAIFPNESLPTIPLFPFAGTAPHGWDFTRFNPAFFRRLEKRIGQLRDLGIQADIILFHPYDKGRWGFDSMAADVDDRYVRYVVARLAAYRNVWWSMANEYDLMKAKTEKDFDRFFQITQASDPYAHLRSVHHSRKIYNNNHPWVTHASIQNGSAVEDDARAELYREVWRKPVVYDEVKYEGNIDKRWGQLSGEEMVHRFWEGTIAGTYVGHSETIGASVEDTWMGIGGVLRGTSPKRLGFLRQVMESGPANGIDPIDKWQDHHLGGEAGSYYLRYFGSDAPTQWPFMLPKVGLAEGQRFTVEILDTWAMTIAPVPGTFTLRKLDDYNFADADGRAVTLPGKPWIALRIRKA